MKTGFIHGYPNKPGKKRYSYHGLERDCLIQPDPDPFQEDPIDVPYGPEVGVDLYAIQNQGWYARERSYLAARNAGTALGWQVWTGQRYEWYYRLYYVFRFGICWDTSGIPGNAKITRATLSQRVISYSSTVEFDVVIRNGGPGHPSIPTVKSDFAYTHYTGEGGRVRASGVYALIIPLTDEGLTFIAKGGITKFALISSRDMEQKVPTTSEEIRYYSTQPYHSTLQIYYKVPL